MPPREEEEQVRKPFRRGYSGAAKLQQADPRPANDDTLTV